MQNVIPINTVSCILQIELIMQNVIQINTASCILQIELIMQNLIPINTASCILQIVPKYLNFNVSKFKITHSDILWEVDENINRLQKNEELFI